LVKPIDAVTSLPRSPDVARLADTAAKQGDIRSHLQTVSFSNEISERARSVAQSHKSEKAQFDPGSGGGGALGGDSMSRKSRKRKYGDGSSKESPHPSKGQIVDIHGA
jgi:hypothetical protein